MDERITIKPGEWIITEGNIPAYYVYELIKGRVSVYRNGSKVNEIEVKEGDPPVFLGIISAMRDDRARAASVRTETEVTAVMHSLDHICGILKNEIPANIRSDINTMIEAILTKNDIDRMTDHLKSLSKVSVDVPENLRDEAKAVVNEIIKLYKKLIQ
jgi:CRP-like cAMP-binding protein